MNSNKLRTIVAAAVFVVLSAGLIAGVSMGTLSGFGWETFSALCPLGGAGHHDRHQDRGAARGGVHRHHGGARAGGGPRVLRVDLPRAAARPRARVLPLAQEAHGA